MRPSFLQNLDVDKLLAKIDLKPMVKGLIGELLKQLQAGNTRSASSMVAMAVAVSELKGGDVRFLQKLCEDLAAALSTVTKAD